MQIIKSKVGSLMHKIQDNNGGIIECVTSSPLTTWDGRYITSINILNLRPHRPTLTLHINQSTCDDAALHFVPRGVTNLKQAIESSHRADL